MATAESPREDGAYELLDSGGGRKLERVGPCLIDRQCAVAFWAPRLPAKEWKKVDAFHHRSEKGGGHWEFNGKLPESWVVRWGGLRLRVKLTAFGHLGFFAEQAHQWEWFRRAVHGRVSRVPGNEGQAPRILNLFAYTGGTSLSLALSGAEVTHVDAAKGVVDWCRQNAELNAVPNERLRLIVDDCLVFLKREERRGRKYDGVILDPPSYGRGPNKEVFKLEDDVLPLLQAVSRVLVPHPLLVHMSSHSQGFSPEVIKNLVTETCPVAGMQGEGGEMLVEEASGRQVPSGTYFRFLAPL